MPRFFGVLFVAVVTLIAVRTPVAVGMPTSPQQYGPPPPVSTAPGGFTAVVTTQTITPAGGTITATVDGAAVTLTVPPGTFPVPVQITVTAPDLAAIGSAGFAGFHAVEGVGVQVSEGGSPFPGTFLRPVTMTVAAPGITSSSVVVVWNGAAFVTESSSTVTAGSATISFDSDPDFAVLSPTGAAVAPISGATTPITGEPFLGEGIVAGVLLLLGAAGLTLVIRRRVKAEA